MIPTLLRNAARWLVWRYNAEQKKLPHDWQNPQGEPIDAMAEKMGIEEAFDPDLDELKSTIKPETVLKEIADRKREARGASPKE